MSNTQVVARAETILELWAKIRKGSQTGSIVTVDDVLEFLANSIDDKTGIPKSFDC